MKRFRSIITVSVVVIAISAAWSNAQAGISDPEEECENSEGTWVCDYDGCYEHCYCVGADVGDRFLPRPQGTECGDFTDYGICDRPDTCDGFGNCEGNVDPGGTLCYSGSEIDCDPDVYCSGNSGDECLSDPLQYIGYSCGDPTDGECDGPDFCDGNGFCDPNYGYEGDPCGNPSDEACNAPDTCDDSGTCVDNKKPAGTLCLASTGECDPEDVCTGTSDFCTPNYAPSGTSCGNDFDYGECDNPDTCDGFGFCDQNIEPFGTVCREKNDLECDVEEVCSGFTGDDCPADSFEPAGTACGDGYDYGECDNPDTCDGFGFCDQNIEPFGTVCREKDDPECDVEEVCSGITGDDCPADAFEPEFTACGNDSDTACTEPDSCDGQGACLPRNESCGLVTSSSLCTFDVQPDKGMCGLPIGSCRDDDNEWTGEECETDEDCEIDETCEVNIFASLGRACAIDPACEAAGGVYCTPDGLCADADGDVLEGDIACSNECPNAELYCKQTGQFRLVFTPDVKQYPAFKLPASNPGQTYYNAIVEGAPGSTRDLYLFVSYPYVTVGGQPVHVYDGADVVGACVDSNGETTGENCTTDADCGSGETCDSSCFAPGDSLAQYDIRWAIEDYFDPDLDPRVDCSSDVCGPAGSGECIVYLEDVPIPDSGLAYVTIHLDYGLKGNWTDANLCDDLLPDRYDQGPSSGSLFAEMGYDALINNDSQDGPVGIYDCTDYYFAHDDDPIIFPYLGVDLAQNLNVFKGISGVGGLALGSLSGQAYEGLKLKLTPTGNPNTVLQTTTTDQDGYYVLPYKHKGKPSLYDVYLSDETETSTLGKITVELQGNGFSQVTFDSEDDPCDAEAAFCECNGWCAAAEYGSGRQSGGSDGGSSGGSCELAQTGDSCNDNSDCCSNSCKGKAGKKVCK